jgi:acyl dehydratase
VTAAVGAPTRPSYADVEVGTELPRYEQVVVRQDLVRYAAASGDLNTIHWDEATARAAGLPDVIAHGMYTMSVAGTALTAWAGGGAVRSFRARFARPVPVPRGEEGTRIVVSGRVVELLTAPAVRVELDVRCDGVKVLARTGAIVELAP